MRTVLLVVVVLVGIGMPTTLGSAAAGHEAFGWLVAGWHVVGNAIHGK